MMTVDEIIKKKKEYGYSYEYISRISGVPVSTVQKVLGRTTSSPRRATLEALSSVFGSDAASGGIYGDADMYEGTGCEAHEDICDYGLTDGTSAYLLSANGNNTIDDYLALPDDVRVELIDGVFYDMASPTFSHQRIAGAIHAVFEQFVDNNHGPCIPMISPSDVQLDCDERTMVQPDVYVICDRDKITRPRLVGAPDLVVEILSPSNWYHDTVRKLRKYKNAGVREYWIVMPKELKILVYVFEESSDPKEYTFEDTVPVYIWGGRCSVDFRKIYEKVSFMLD